MLLHHIRLADAIHLLLKEKAFLVRANKDSKGKVTSVAILGSEAAMRAGKPASISRCFCGANIYHDGNEKRKVGGHIRTAS